MTTCLPGLYGLAALDIQQYGRRHSLWPANEMNELGSVSAPARVPACSE
jgi:hypothetical protein